jgi:hypothetical protein
MAIRIRRLSTSGGFGFGLEKEFPEILRSEVSQLIVHASLRSQAEAEKLAAVFGGGAQDFFAIRYLLACQALTIPECQAGVVRAAIRAISSFLE